MRYNSQTGLSQILPEVTELYMISQSSQGSWAEQGSASLEIEQLGGGVDGRIGDGVASGKLGDGVGGTVGEIVTGREVKEGVGFVVGSSLVVIVDISVGNPVGRIVADGIVDGFSRSGPQVFV